jgi:hypothetical protein
MYEELEEEMKKRREWSKRLVELGNEAQNDGQNNIAIVLLGLSGCLGVLEDGGLARHTKKFLREVLQTTRAHNN